MLPKEVREERAVERFLEYYNQTSGTSYQIMEWLDRSPRIGKGQQAPIPDCLCKDQVSGTEMVIERTMLADEEDLKLSEGANEFLTEVRARLECKLPGVFLLHDWGVDKIRYTANTREGKIAQLCQEILRVAPTLAEGQEAQLCQPFAVKLTKEESRKVIGNCALIYHPPSRAPDLQGLERRFEKILDEANKKFANYTDKSTVLLVNIWETTLEYRAFEEDLFQSVDMRKYPNIEHIYLSEGLPCPIIYRLWSRRKA